MTALTPAITVFCCCKIMLKKRVDFNIHETPKYQGKYEDETISKQPIPFPIVRVGQHFHALFQYILYVGTKLRAYRFFL